MSLYYFLSEDDYKGKTEDIGPIMMNVSRALYNVTGLSLGNYCGPTNEELQLLMETQGLQIFNEEVLWYNMTDNEKSEKFSQYLCNIGSENAELLIIDPYIFAKNKDIMYPNLLATILCKSKAKSITVITDKSKYSQNVYDTVLLEVSLSINVIFSDEWHDRFWIADGKAGFISGASLNGVGKRRSLINYLNDEDLTEIMNDVNKMRS